jgi:hypothetical protein
MQQGIAGELGAQLGGAGPGIGLVMPRVKAGCAGSASLPLPLRT